MPTKLLCVLVLALGAPACVTDGDDAPPPSTGDETQLDPPPDDDLPPSDDLPPDPTCGPNALKEDRPCLPQPH